MLRNLQVISAALTFGACVVFGVFASLAATRAGDAMSTGLLPLVLLALAAGFVFAAPVIAKALAPRDAGASLDAYARAVTPSRILRLALREAAALQAGLSVFLGGELAHAAPVALVALLAMLLDFPSQARLTSEREALAGQRLPNASA